MNNKETNLKEKLKQALTSTIKVISDDIKINDHKENNKKGKSSQSFEISDLNSKNDFIKARAESDASALKKKFSDEKVFNQNLPLKTSCRSLYSIAEKIRYEALGFKMLSGIKKNIKDNYNEIIKTKKKDQQ